MTSNGLADFKVGDRLVRPSLGEISDDTQTVHIEPRSMEVLLALAERGNEVYPKRELIERVWRETYVSDEVLTHAIWDLRRAFGDQANDPKFIQTIPKRGYRLIAPVSAAASEPSEPVPSGHAGETPSGPSSPWRRRVAWVAAGTVLLLFAAWAWQNRGASQPSSGPPRIVVAPLRDSAADESASLQLALDISRRLSGRPGIVASRAEECPPSDRGRATYCLEVSVSKLVAGQRAHIELSQDALLFSRERPLSATNGSRDDLADEVAAYFDMIRHPYHRDPDSAPFLDISKNDLRAVVLFLEGMQLVYTNEVGGGVLLDEAIDLDSNFIAPRVIRLLTHVEVGDDDTVQRYLSHFRTLFPKASAFEKALIQFAEHYAQGELAGQLRWLEHALEEAPANRPVEFVLSTVESQLGNAEEACDRLSPLVDTSWHFPPVYWTSASCRIELGQLDAARAAIAAGLELEKKDPQLLVIAVLLAIYDGNTEEEGRFLQRLDQRVREIAPEEFSFGSTTLQEALAQQAESAGRSGAAKKIREFSY